MSKAILPDGNSVEQIGTTMSKWVDDFGLNGGGVNAVDPTNWDIFDGGTYDTGKAANAANSCNGSGVSLVGGVSVANSTLLVNMGTTVNAEVHLLSKQTFTCPFDVYVGLKLSQAIVNNSVYVEFVEVDPATGLPIPHKTLNDARNRVGALMGGASATTVFLEAVADDSPNGVNNVTTATFPAWTADTDIQLEYRPCDTWLNGVVMDSPAARTGNALRLSKQVPDPNKLYKLRLRFKNGGVAPASATTVTIYRVLVCDVQEVQVELASGRGDTAAGKAIPAAVVSLPALVAGTAKIGGVEGIASTTSNGLTPFRRVATADTNTAVIKATPGKLVGGCLVNLSAADKFLKLFNKTTAPVLGTDTPAITIRIPANGQVPIAQLFDQYGYSFATGISMALTGVGTDADATALAAADVIVQLLYV